MKRDTFLKACKFVLMIGLLLGLILLALYVWKLNCVKWFGTFRRETWWIYSLSIGGILGAGIFTGEQLVRRFYGNGDWSFCAVMPLYTASVFHMIAFLSDERTGIVVLSGYIVQGLLLAVIGTFLFLILQKPLHAMERMLHKPLERLAGVMQSDKGL